jgi:hypothetical protein
MVAGNRRAPAGKPVGAFSWGQQAVAHIEREFHRYLGCGILDYYEYRHVIDNGCPEDGQRVAFARVPCSIKVND